MLKCLFRSELVFILYSKIILKTINCICSWQDTFTEDWAEIIEKNIINQIHRLLFLMDRLITKLNKLFLWFLIIFMVFNSRWARGHGWYSVNSDQFFLKRVSMNARHNSLKLILPTFALVNTVPVFQSQSNRIPLDEHMLLLIHLGVLHFFEL